MEFRETLWKARGYDRKAMMEIIEMYRPPDGQICGCERKV